MKKPLLCGVDVSAKELVVAFDPGTGRVWGGTFSNDTSGQRKLIRRITRTKAPVRVCIEATGIYHIDLALALDRATGVEVMVANPRATKDFARAQMRRSKTDHTDAHSLLEFARRMDFEPWTPPRPSILALRALSRRIQALLTTRAQEKNRLHANQQSKELSDFVKEDIRELVEILEGRISRLRKQALLVIEQSPELAKAFGHITSIKGIADAAGIQLLAELGTLPKDMTTRQWVAHAGLDPRQHRSGTSVYKPARISKTGNAHLRRALFLPAMVAARWEPNVKAFYEKLLGRGKTKMQALVAVMRKLLHAIHGMLEHDQDFDGEKFFAVKG